MNHGKILLAAAALLVGPAAREAYRERGAASADIEWAIQNARLVYQFMAHLRSPFEMRDRFMAENVKWIAEQDPEAGIVLWAHNAHVATAGYSIDMMGSHLRRDFGDEMAVFGFAFNQGGFQAIDAASSTLREHSAPAAKAGSFDAMLASAGVPLFALDLRGAPRLGPGALLRQTLPTRSIGAVYDTRFPDAYSVRRHHHPGAPGAAALAGRRRGCPKRLTFFRGATATSRRILFSLRLHQPPQSCVLGLRDPTGYPMV
jgi:erythromycin esterase-like protein